MYAATSFAERVTNTGPERLPSRPIASRARAAPAGETGCHPPEAPALVGASAVGGVGPRWSSGIQRSRYSHAATATIARNTRQPRLLRQPNMLCTLERDC